MSNKISAKGAAHDLRHLLTIVCLTAEQLEAADSADVSLKAARILRSVDRAAEICTSLLQERDVDTMTSIGRVIADVISQIETPDGVRLSSDCPDDLYINKPQAPLFRLLFNLTLNAISAINASSGSEVVIRARELDSHIVVLVQDDGPGFGALDEVEEPRGKADGLGLRIAQSCAAELGGHLELVDREPVGAAIAVWLPRPKHWPAEVETDSGVVLSA